MEELIPEPVTAGVNYEVLIGRGFREQGSELGMSAYEAALGNAGVSSNVLIVDVPGGGRTVLYYPSRPSGVAYMHARRDLAA